MAIGSAVAGIGWLPLALQTTLHALEGRPEVGSWIALAIGVWITLLASAGVAWAFARRWGGGARWGAVGGALVSLVAWLMVGGHASFLFSLGPMWEALATSASGEDAIVQVLGSCLTRGLYAFQVGGFAVGLTSAAVGAWVGHRASDPLRRQLGLSALVWPGLLVACSVMGPILFLDSVVELADTLTVQGQVQGLPVDGVALAMLAHLSAYLVPVAGGALVGFSVARQLSRPRGGVAAASQVLLVILMIVTILGSALNDDQLVVRPWALLMLVPGLMIGGLADRALPVAASSPGQSTWVEGLWTSLVTALGMLWVSGMGSGILAAVYLVVWIGPITTGVLEEPVGQTVSTGWAIYMSAVGIVAMAAAIASLQWTLLVVALQLIVDRVRRWREARSSGRSRG